MVSQGSHEFRVWQNIPDSGIELDTLLLGDGGSTRVGLNKAVASGWVRIVKKDDGKSWVERCLNVEVVDVVKSQLLQIINGDSAPLGDDVITDLKRRRLVVSNSVTTFTVSRGANFSQNVERPEAELTAEMMANEEYAKKNFKPYNFNAMGTTLQGGHLHPLLKVSLINYNLNTTVIS